MLLLLLIIILIIISLIYLLTKKDLKTYYINLDHNTLRNKHFLEQTSLINLKCDRFPGVYGKQLNKNILNTIPKKTLKNLEYDKYPGRLGCFMSHCNLYKEIIDNKLQQVVILEDDVDFCSNFKSKLNKAMSQLPKDWDVLLIGKKFKNKIPNLDYSQDLLELRDHFTGMYGYVINYNSATKLFKDICSYSKMYTGIDVQLRDLFTENNNYKCFSTKYNLVTPSKNNNVRYSNIWNKLITYKE